MADTVLDVALILPGSVSARAIAVGGVLADRMADDENPSYFRLGDPFPRESGTATATAGDRCEPHISLFMLAVDETETPGVAAALGRVAAAIPALPAEGAAYGRNPHGAPELYFRMSPAWARLQRRVVDAVEPLRCGRLRELDPAGEKLHDVVSDERPPDPERVRQLMAYGYDEITDELGDRFKPHVTFAWPTRPHPRVELAGLPPASAFDCTFDRLGLYEMSPWGTCTRLHGVFPLLPRMI